MPVAPGLRRGPRAVPRDRSQGLAALGFFQSFTRIAFRNNDPRVACAEAGHAKRGRRLPESGPDAIPGPPAIRAPEGRLVPRSRTPDRVWARAARALAAGYTPRQVS
ncbi:hypothetical protein HL658_26325 [Azospirillum sp. RWY-5-1]|uniref:Uncharacterized protein n=1 Tax=Azospirillum oleiclasticum TaxID=2735135 RepID=A0ABX2TF28_9PROT|nr:hypothetical protein [Azospirillum oleiclasticum]NYZ16071.1 hypothetical protein [Azospirillum oleiclasticum]NYZ22952.1 hypothetical protein [Azospirillum oleiclasticum]